MKNDSIEVTAVYRGLAKTARRLHLALEQLPAELRVDLQRATLDQGDVVRRNAINQLVAASQSLNAFASGSVVDDEDWYASAYADGFRWHER